MGGCCVSLGEFVLSCVSGDFSAWADALTGWGSMPGACPHVYLDGAPGSFATPSLLLSCKLRANGCVTQEVIEVPPVLRHSLSCFCVSLKFTQLSIRSHGRHNLTGHSDSQSHEHTCTGSHRCTHTLLTHLHRHTLTCTFAHSNTCVHSHSLTEHTHALALVASPSSTHAHTSSLTFPHSLKLTHSQSLSQSTLGGLVRCLRPPQAPGLG